MTGFIKKTLGDSFEEFIKIMLKNCGINEKLGDRPVRVRYGLWYFSRICKLDVIPSKI